VSTIAKTVKLTDDGRLLISTAALSKAMNTSVKTLAEWAKAGMPKESTGWWDLAAVLAWRGQSVGAGKAEEMSDEARKLRADADFREVRAAREKRMMEIIDGQYIEKTELESEWARRIIEMKSALLLLAKKVSTEFTDATIRRTVEKVITSEVYSMLEQYSREGAYTPVANKKRSGKLAN